MLRASLAAFMVLGSVAMSHGAIISMDCKTPVIKTPIKIVIDTERNIGQRQGSVNPHRNLSHGIYASARVSDTEIAFNSKNVDGSVDADFTIARATGSGTVSFGAAPGRTFPIECVPDTQPAALLKPLISINNQAIAARCRRISFPTAENPNPVQNGVFTKERSIFNLAASEVHILEDSGRAGEKRKGMVVREDYILLTDPPIAGSNYNIFFNLITGMAMTIDKRTASVLVDSIHECKFEPFDTAAQK